MRGLEFAKRAGTAGGAQKMSGRRRSGRRKMRRMLRGRIGHLLNGLVAMILVMVGYKNTRPRLSANIHRLQSWPEDIWLSATMPRLLKVP